MVVYFGLFALVLFNSVFILSRVHDLLASCLLTAIVVALFGMIRASVQGSRLAFTLLLGAVVPAVLFIYEFIGLLDIVEYVRVAVYAIVLLVFSQAYIMARQFAAAYQKAEHLAKT